MPVSYLNKVGWTVRFRPVGSRSPTIYLEVTQAFTVCSLGYQNNQCQNDRRKAILLTSSCIRPIANSDAESVVCPYMASAQLPPSGSPCPLHSLYWPALYRQNIMSNRWENPYFIYWTHPDSYCINNDHILCTDYKHFPFIL